MLNKLKFLQNRPTHSNHHGKRPLFIKGWVYLVQTWGVFTIALIIFIHFPSFLYYLYIIRRERWGTTTGSHSHCQKNRKTRGREKRCAIGGERIVLTWHLFAKEEGTGNPRTMWKGPHVGGRTGGRDEPRFRSTTGWGPSPRLPLSPSLND